MDIQEKLKRLVTRRHPEYANKIEHWNFLVSTYEGGREWFKGNVFKYMKEGDSEFKDRLERAYRFNHSREVVDLVDKYLFKMEIARNEADAPESVREFWKHATLDGLKVQDFVKVISRWTSVVGRVWVVVDSTKTEETTTLAEEKVSGHRIYAYYVMPQNACDMSYDEQGQLNWILIHEQVRDDSNPLESNGDISDRFRLWEREQYSILKIKRKAPETLLGSTPAGLPGVSVRELAKRTAEAIAKGKLGEVATISADAVKGSDSDAFEVELEGPYPHEFGMVPVFAANNVINNDPYACPALIDDVAYLDRAVANYLSNLDAIIQDQTFSQLVIPAQSLINDGEGKARDALVEMGTKRIFAYDGESGSAPGYISPDVKQAEIILKVINKIINEIYHSVGLAGERTKEDNALGIDNSSGVAKAYDFERVNSLLAAKADSLELIENKLAEFVARWAGEDYEVTKPVVSYPDNFDVRGLYDEFEIAARLALIKAPDGARRQQMEAVIDKMFPQLKEGIKKAILDELKNWPPKEEPEGASQTSPIESAGNNQLANELVK